MTEMPNFPIDIIREILVRLPVKSLLRFRCVSKEWRSLITDSFFITLHHNRSKREMGNPSLIVIDGTSLYTVEDNSCHKVDIPLYISKKLWLRHLWDFDREIAVVGSCNGLLCFSIGILVATHYSDPIFLLNPATREFKALPCCPLENLGAATNGIGFGFDPVSNDYKVVFIAYYDQSNEYESWILQNDVWIYSLNSDNWRKLGDIPVPDVCFNFSSLSPVLNAAIHWISRETGSIFCFDLVQELFREIPPPLDNGIYKDVVVMGGCLSVFYNLINFMISSNSCEIWVMKEYGVKESWTKQLIITNGNPFNYTPIEFRNDVILFQRERNKLVFYNTKSNTVRKTRIHGLPIKCTAFVSYTKSLVMLDGVMKRVEGKKRRRRSDVEFCCFVGGLAWVTDDRDLEWAFSPYGEIIESKIITDRETGKSRGFGFVTFCDEQSMRNAIQGMNGQYLDGRKIIVELAHSRGGGSHGGGRRSGDGGGYGCCDRGGGYSGGGYRPAGGRGYRNSGFLRN